MIWMTFPVPASQWIDHHVKRRLESRLLVYIQTVTLTF